MKIAELFFLFTMNYLFSGFCFVVTVLILLFSFFKRRFSYWSRHNVPYSKPSIPFGNLKGVGSSKHVVDFLDEMYFKFKDHSPMCGVYFSVVPVAIVTNLDLVKSILIMDHQQFPDRSWYVNEIDDPLTNNMFMVGGERWRTLRHQFTPMFTPGKIKVTYPTSLDVSINLVDHIDKVLRIDNCFDIKDVVARFTVDIIGRVAFGIECNSLADPNAEFRIYGNKAMTEARHSKIVNEFLNQCPQIGRFLRMKTFPDSVINFFCGVVKETVAFREKNNIHRNDFMDMLIAMKNETRADYPKLSMDELIGQVFLFFLAGFETSSSIMSFALVELSINEELQQKARKNVNEVLAKHNGEMTFEAIMEMNYVGQVLLESLRKYPLLSALSRKADKDYPIPGTNMTIEKGIGVLIPVHSIHYDPDIYPDPERFDPDRFSQENINKRHSASFLGFGDGPRNCIGKRLGSVHGRLGLATILKHYRFKASQRTQLPLRFDPTTIVYTLIGGIYLIMEKIEN